MSYSTIVFEKSVEEKLGIITLNRPEVRNAINPAMREDLSRCFLELEADTDVRAILITGVQKSLPPGLISPPWWKRRRWSNSVELRYGI